MSAEDFFDAVESGDVEKVKKYIAEGIDVNQLNSDGDSAVEIAIIEGNKEIVNIFLGLKSIDINYQDKVSGYTYLHLAVEYEHSDIVKQLLSKKGINVNLQTKEAKQTPIVKAMYTENLEIVEELLKVKDIDVNIPDVNGNTPLLLAINGMYLEYVEKLLKVKDINVNIQDSKGNTPLHLATRSNFTDLTKELLKVKDINPNLQLTGIKDAPIHLAIKGGKLAILKELLKYEKVDVNLQNENYTPLILAIKGHNDTDAVRELLKRPDIDVEKKDAAENRPLRYAVYRQNLPIVQALFDRGADVNGTSVNGFTALHEACVNGSLDIVKELLKRGASIEKKLTTGGVTDSTPLITAAMYKHDAIVKELLDAGANPNTTTSEGVSPLYLSCHYSRIAAVKSLLAKGADVNLAITGGQSKGRTPLYVACLSASAEVVEELLKIPEGPAAIDKASEGSRMVLQAAKDGKFTPEIQKLILAFFKEKGPGDEPWKGWTRSDAVAMDAIFGAIEPHKIFPHNERYAFVPLDDITYCPICLAYTPRIGKEGETKGCMYMYHNCKKTAGVILHEGLYDKYKGTDGLIWWCTICNRIAKGHQHYALGPPEVEGPTPRVLPATGSPFDKSCKPGHGGGGTEEKIRRFMRLREVAKELTERAGEITKQEAVNTLVEEMWTAGLTERRNAKRVAAALATKEFPNKAANFPANRPNNSAPNRNYPNLTRSAANLADLKPEISRDVAKWDSIAVDTIAPAVLFHHRKPDGTIVHHKKGKEDGEDGEWIGFSTLEDIIKNYVKNFKAEGFGMCPLDCGARLYPDEVKNIVPKDLYEAYQKAFNRYPWPKDGGGKKRQTRRRARSQRGGTASYSGLFHPLKDALCVKPWKVGRNTRKGNV